MKSTDIRSAFFNDFWPILIETKVRFSGIRPAATGVDTGLKPRSKADRTAMSAVGKRLRLSPASSGQRWPPLILLQSGRSSTPRIPFSLQPHGVHPHDGKLRGLPQCD